MARKAQYGERELAAARELVATAKTRQQLRQGQAILLPALTGASIETTAQVLGIGRNQVCVLRREFRKAGGTTFGEHDRRGGRRHELLTPEQEKAFLAPWLAYANGADSIVLSAIHAAYELRIGKPVPRSTVYRLLARHGLRNASGNGRALAGSREDGAVPALFAGGDSV